MLLSHKGALCLGRHPILFRRAFETATLSSVPKLVLSVLGSHKSSNCVYMVLLRFTHVV